MDLSIILPVFNNAASLPELVSRLISTCDQLLLEYELLFINDGSKDESELILSDLADSCDRVKLINLSRNFGQHPAISAGFQNARGSLIILMDADLQDSPEHIGILIQHLCNNDVDIVYTVKQPENGQSLSRPTSILYHKLFSKLVGAPVPSHIGTFRGFNRQVLEALLEFGEVNVLYGPLMFFIGFKSLTLALPYQQRRFGKSSYTFWKRLRLAADSLISYTNLPHNLTMFIGAGVLTMTLAYVILILVQYLIFGISLPSGLTIIIILMCTLVGAVLVSLGIVGSYVFRIYQEVLRRPRYLIRSTRNI